jgi:hypothetical protein
MTQISPSNHLGPLHFLANIVSDMSDGDSLPASPSQESSPVSSKSSCSIPPSFFFQDVAYLRKAGVHSLRRTLRHATSSIHLPDPSFVPFIRQHSARKTRKVSESNLKSKLQIKRRRKELLEKAIKIKSLDNSPVNERQLLLLRMVYDQITMYPCESWMVLIAIIIHRAYKQVKNWFSNERQKNRSGESVAIETEDGDKVRLRSQAVITCQDWSDSFFEEVVMIYNYRIQQNFRAKGPGPQPDSITTDES